jgi:hypothetical protein
MSLGERPPSRLWSQAGGAQQAGRGEVIGVIDTGVGPDNPSLAGIPISDGTLARRYPGFTGVCESGERWRPSNCNSKVIAAQYFVRGFGAADVATSDYLSPRDGSGHGTGVAAIAAGNAGIDTEIGGQSFGRISGLAPAAAVSVYKACWSAPDPRDDGCDTADVVAAIDRAVRDGVDVLNYSIAGSATAVGDAVDLAFLNAAAAHVFVAASAGNGGPHAGTVEHLSPWVTTVGANTRAVLQGGVRLGDGRTLIGAMLSDSSVPRTRLVAARDAAARGVSPAHAALCFPGSLDAQRIDGAIVVCERGTTSRVSKSAEVAQSGGSGMLLLNTAPGSVDADLHAVPTVHLSVASGRQVQAYLAAAGRHATASIDARATDHPPVPVTAGFSGRGPSPVADGDLLKPDLTAPGVSVVTAVSTPSTPAQRWDVESGTSIAAPHVAGVAAVVRAVHPLWTPAAIKSALMTTATPLAGSDGPWARGAGQLTPASALRPGLVYDSTVAQMARLLDTGHDFDASTLNQPSVAVSDLVGTQSVSRTVINVGTTTTSFTPTVQGLHGIGASVSPGVLTVAPGEHATFTITFTATKNAHYNRFAAGSLTWRDAAGTTVTIPLAVKAELASVPTHVAGSGRQGAAEIHAVAGVTGTITTATSGLVGATPVQLRLQPGGFDPDHPSTSVSTAVETLTVAAGSPAARFQVTPKAAGDDLDLYVYRGRTLVASATGPKGSETVTLLHPVAGTYQVYVNAHRAATGSVAAEFTSWVLPQKAEGNLTLGPRSVGVDGGQRFSTSLRWSHLSEAKRWWGYVSYQGLPDVTYVTVN